MSESAAQESQTEVSGIRIHSQEAGTGPTLVFLHHSFGTPGWVPLFADLAADHRVLAPDLPGFGQSSRPEWARHPRDLAILIGQWLSAKGLARPHLIGAGFGGWVAAELATMRPDALASLTLVGAAGVLPREGRISDQFLIAHRDYVEMAFHDRAAYEAVYGAELEDAQLVRWDEDREMTTRVSWKPYMLNRRMMALLGGVQAPTLVVHGEHDAIVPRCCAEDYASLLPNAHLEIAAGCGHAVDLEHPQALAKLVREHVAAH
jgi:pimeloyl-ACP methyl ester carboxylesterase